MWISKYKYLILIILFALSLRIIFFSSLDGSDQCVYARIATMIADGEINHLDGHFFFRLGNNLPNALMVNIFGKHRWTFAILPMVSSLGLIILTYIIALRLFDEKTAIIASLLFSILPHSVFYASLPDPDIPLAFYCGLAVLMFLKGDEPVGGEKKHTKSFFFICGLFLGIAYMTKIPALSIFPFLAIYIIFNKKYKIEYLYIPFGFIFVLLGEGIIYYLIKDDFFHRFNVMWNLRTGGGKDMEEVFAENPGISGKALLLDRIFRLTNWFDPFARWFAFWNINFYFIFFAIFYGLILRNKKMHFLTLWFMISFLFITLGSRSISIKYYLPLMSPNPKYLSIVALPGVLCSAWLCRTIWKKLPLKILLCGAITCLVGCSALGIYTLNMDSKIRVFNEKEIIKFLDSNPDIQLYTHPKNRRSILCQLSYKKYKEKIINYDIIDYPIPSGAYVAINRSWIHHVMEREPENILKFDPDNLPSNWEKVKTIVPPTRKSIRGTILGKEQREEENFSFRTEIYLVK